MTKQLIEGVDPVDPAHLDASVGVSTTGRRLLHAGGGYLKLSPPQAPRRRSRAARMPPAARPTRCARAHFLLPRRAASAERSRAAPGLSTLGSDFFLRQGGRIRVERGGPPLSEPGSARLRRLL